MGCSRQLSLPSTMLALRQCWGVAGMVPTQEEQCSQGHREEA